MNLTSDFLCDPYPNPDKINFLLTRMRNRLCESFIYLSSQISKMGLNYDTLISDIDKYRNSDYPLSIISSFHERLISLLKIGNPHEIVLLFDDFKNLNVKRKAFSLISHHSPNQRLSLTAQQII